MIYLKTFENFSGDDEHDHTFIENMLSKIEEYFQTNGWEIISVKTTKESDLYKFYIKITSEYTVKCFLYDDRPYNFKAAMWKLYHHDKYGMYYIDIDTMPNIMAAVNNPKAR